MPITISGSGTIAGISTGGLPDGCIATDDLANNAVTAGKMGTTEQSRLCAAFVNFNGTGTVAIRASYNVSSITDNGVGQYTVNFTTALADANHSTVVTTATAATWVNRGDEVNSSSSSAVSVRHVENNVFADTSVLNVITFR